MLWMRAAKHVAQTTQDQGAGSSVHQYQSLPLVQNVSSVSLELQICFLQPSKISGRVNEWHYKNFDVSWGLCNASVVHLGQRPWVRTRPHSSGPASPSSSSPATAPASPTAAAEVSGRAPQLLPLLVVFPLGLLLLLLLLRLNGGQNDGC